jgi:hypothetical protein
MADTALTPGTPAPTTPAAATTTPAVTTSNPTASTWRESLPEDIRNENAFSVFSDVGGLARSYLNAQKLVGAEKIPVPGKHATDEDWNQIFAKLGRPDSPDKYELDLPKEAKVNEDFVKEFKAQAHKLGFNPKQAKELLGWYQQKNETFEKQYIETQTRKQQEAVDGLKKEWGQGYETEVAKAQAALQEYDDDSLKLSEHLATTGYGNDPVLIKFFAKLGKSLGEDKLRGNGAVSMGMTPATAQTKINEIFGNKDHPYNQPNHPSHRDAVKEMEGYFKMLSA